MNSDTLYHRLLAKKTPWTPIIGTKLPVMPGAEKTIAKCLALRILEIPVGEWILESGRQETDRLSDIQKQLIKSNSEDEKKHDLALSMAAKLYVDLGDFLEEAKLIANEWLDCNDHPIVKAFVIENGVFFVLLPILRVFGNAGLRTLSKDISQDEGIHAPTNRQISLDLGYWYSEKLDRLRKDTVDWLVSDLDCPGRHGIASYWQKRSDTLTETGKAEDLEELTGSFLGQAFFEISNSNLSSYN